MEAVCQRERKEYERGEHHGFILVVGCLGFIAYLTFVGYLIPNSLHRVKYQNSSILNNSV